MATPKLRFPAFEEKWNKQRLDSFLERVSNPIDVIPNKKYSQIGIRSHGKGIFHKEAVTGEELGNKRVFWVEPNALVVNIVFAWERAIAVTSDAEKGMIASHRFPMYLPKNNLSNVNFLRYLFVTDKGQSYLELASPGGAGRNKTLGQSNFSELKIDLPSLEEQTKIATFLSTVDEKISQLSQKLHLLGQYKQGMMQKLFSQQIRFKANDGSEFGDWEILKFKDVITIKYGKDHKKLKDGNIPVLGTGGIMRYVESYLYDGESILIGRKGTIDKPQFISGKFWTVDTLFYTEIGEKIRPKFAFQQLLLVNWLNLNEATGVPSLNTTSIGNIELKVPSLEEQTKIANFLSAIDQKIDVVSEQLEQAKLWKKGLLQQMFV